MEAAGAAPVAEAPAAAGVRQRVEPFGRDRVAVYPELAPLDLAPPVVGSKAGLSAEAA